MSRNKGTFDFSNNFEVRARSPLDAKQRVGLLSDLTSPTQWQSNTGDEWTYPGMIVSVYNDGVNNGVYRLNATDYTNASNWDKLGGSGDIIALSVALSNEISTRTSTDSVLSSNISSETSTRTAADITLSSAISSEISSRSAGDSTLSSNLSSEVATRAGGDSTLSSNISSETSSRISGDGSLTTRISTEESKSVSDNTSLINTYIGNLLYTRTPGSGYPYSPIHDNETHTTSINNINNALYPYYSQWYETTSSSSIHWYYGTSSSRMGTQYSSTYYYVTCNKYGKMYTIEFCLAYTVPAAADGQSYIYMGPFPEIQSGAGSPYFWSGLFSIHMLYYNSQWYVTRSTLDSQMICMNRADGGHFNAGQAYQLNFKGFFPTY